MSTELVIYQDEAGRFGADPYADMVAAAKARQRRLEFVAWEARRERERQAEEARQRHEECVRQIAEDRERARALIHRPKRKIWKDKPKPKAKPDPQFEAADQFVLPAQKGRIIVRVVSRNYGIPYMDVFSAKRNADIVACRMVAVAMVKKKLPQWSLPQTGRFFGGRDHTTALYSIRKISDRLQWDEEFQSRFASLEAQIEAEFEAESLRKRVVEPVGRIERVVAECTA